MICRSYYESCFSRSEFRLGYKPLPKVSGESTDSVVQLFAVSIQDADGNRLHVI